MRVFEQHGRVNFVDEFNVFVGFDMQPGCCESFGYYFEDAVSTGAERVNEQEDCDADGTPKDIESWSFDPKFFRQTDSAGYDEGGVAVFRLVSGEREKFLHLFNSHNGYYGHGFEFKVGDTVKQEGTL